MPRSSLHCLHPTQDLAALDSSADAAPINGGKYRKLDLDLDKSERLKISYEFGNSRIDIVSAYIGGQT